MENFREANVVFGASLRRDFDSKDQHYILNHKNNGKTRILIADPCFHGERAFYDKSQFIERI